MLRSPMGRCALIAGLLIVFSRAALASPNLISNGDFELGTYAGTGGSTGDTLPNSWTNAPPSSLTNLNVFANGSGPGTAESGTHYVAFQSTSTSGGQDCLNYVASTVAGQQYTISFYVAMTASSGSQFGLSPEWDSGGAHDTTMGTAAFYYHPDNATAHGWTLFSFTETASSSSTSIYFHGADATGAVLLDNVVLNAVPEPGSWALALPLAFFWLLARRRRPSALVVA